MKLPPAFVTGTQQINVLIETPKGSGTKFTFDPETGLFELTKIFPAGVAFPYHFGFIPGTKAEDGDPLDVLVLMDEAMFPGTFLACRVLGVIEASQKERSGETVRNDRIIAAATVSHRYADIQLLSDLDNYLIEEITAFFIHYNAMSNKEFIPLKNSGPKKAISLIKKQLTNE